MSSIAAVSVAAAGKITLTITPTATQSVYVFRRDSIGVGTVRAASDGIAVTSGTPVAIDDFEPRQGDSTDYLLTDADGVLLGSTNLIVPTWGSWFKSPGKPWLNVLSALRDESPEKLPAVREIVRIEGAERAVVLSAPRQGSEGAITLSVRTETELQDVRELLADGGPLLIDVAPSFGVPYRYVSVGDVSIDREWHELGLDKRWRGVKLDQLVEIDSPLGPLDVSATATYDALPTKFPTYAAMAAIVPTYNALAVY